MSDWTIELPAELEAAPATQDKDIVWSYDQQAIFKFFQHGQGHLVIIARAGTGKTTTLLRGIDFAPERKIFVTSFSKEITDELTRRLTNPNAKAQGLHSFGMGRILQSGWGVVNGEKPKLDKARSTNIIRKLMGNEANEPDLIQVIEDIAAIVSLAKGSIPFAITQDLIDLAEDRCLIPTDELVRRGWNVTRYAKLAREVMHLSLDGSDGTFDFDDMIYVPVAKKLIRPTFGLVVVDEAQDMNFSQLLLAQAACVRNGRIIVVGDDRQGIYGFRGADSKSLDRLKRELNASELSLSTTRRCAKRIVALAAKLVPDFRAADEAPEGEIHNVNADRLVGLAQGGDFILSRKNAPLLAICFALLRAGKRAKIRGRDVGAGITRLVKKLNARSMPDFFTRLDKWRERELKKAKKHDSEAAQEHIASVNDRYETLKTIANGASSPAALITRIDSLFADDAPSSSFIMCSSVHKAKGLETDRVFMLTDTFYPGGRTDIEEQNLEYVAITRAKQALYLVKGA